jgi:dihydrofolate reductase/thymidylate synthase
MFSLIVSASEIGGIGKENGEITWHNSADIKMFKTKTTSNIVIMGRKTWDTLPLKFKPLPNRLNIIMSKTLSYDHPDVMIFSSINNCLIELSKQKYKEKEKFVIGGSTIYNYFLDNNLIHKIYYTMVRGYVESDIFLNTKYTYHFLQLSGNWKNKWCPTISNELKEADKSGKYEWSYSTFFYVNREENNYLSLIQHLLENGNERIDRTGTGTLADFGKQLEFDVSNSFPLLTTKFVSFKNILTELLWFLKGQTNSKILEEQGVNIWKKNTSREFLDNKGLADYDEGDIGPMYFWQIYHFGAEYTGMNTDYTEKGINQLDEVIHLLKTDPFSRRILMTTYNVRDRHRGVLYPCHGVVIQFFVRKDDKGTQHLSLHMYQRSSDSFLGLPYNISSYSLLLYIIALKVNMKPDKVIISMGDVHIYKNHIEQVILQLSRNPYPFPKLILNEEIRNKEFMNIVKEDFKLVGYKYHPTIKADMSA